MKLLVFCALLGLTYADMAARELYQHAKARRIGRVPRTGRNANQPVRLRPPRSEERFDGFGFEESPGFPGDFPPSDFNSPNNRLPPQNRPVFKFKQRPVEDGARYDANGNRIRKRGYNTARQGQPAPVRPEFERPVRRVVDHEREAVIEEEIMEVPEGLETSPSQPKAYKPASGPAPAYNYDANAQEYAEAYPMPNFEPLQMPAEPRNGDDGIPLEQRDIQSAVFAGANAYKPDGVYQTEDRLEFQIHGHQGPHSYRYGYDTGHGYNRQFRYEERDDKGYVKGRYGFFDKYGKLQVINYTADPYKGFHAEGAHVPKYPH